ncbi:MAG: RNA methyltransferase, partial [Gemmataceae bacterium]|nr:RNA methyltransferase [Gemmataceae bacterium]
LDSSGDSLHRRGYRPVQLRAPINEALAAGIILRTGWDASAPFADPMCGSGTLPIEAAWIALRRPPGLTRKRFGFMGWLDHDRGEWAAMRDEARMGILKALPAPVLGSDERTDAVEHARQNARAAGIGHALDFQRTDFRHVRLPETPGTVLLNPPYGERIGEEKDLIPLYRAIGDLARRCPGWRVWVFTGNERLGRAVGLPPRQAVKLFNGKIPCQLLEFGA